MNKWKWKTSHAISENASGLLTWKRKKKFFDVLDENIQVSLAKIWSNPGPLFRSCFANDTVVLTKTTGMILMFCIFNFVLKPVLQPFLYIVTFLSLLQKLWEKKCGYLNQNLNFSLDEANFRMENLVAWSAFEDTFFEQAFAVRKCMSRLIYSRGRSERLWKNTDFKAKKNTDFKATFQNNSIKDKASFFDDRQNIIFQFCCFKLSTKWKTQN